MGIYTHTHVQTTFCVHTENAEADKTEHSFSKKQQQDKQQDRGHFG